MPWSVVSSYIIYPMGSSDRDWLKSTASSNLEGDCCLLIFLAQRIASYCTPTCKRPCQTCSRCSMRRDFSRWNGSVAPFRRWALSKDEQHPDREKMHLPDAKWYSSNRSAC